MFFADPRHRSWHCQKTGTHLLFFFIVGQPRLILKLQKKSNLIIFFGTLFSSCASPHYQDVHYQMFNNSVTISVLQIQQ